MPRARGDGGKYTRCVGVWIGVGEERVAACKRTARAAAKWVRGRAPRGPCVAPVRSSAATASAYAVAAAFPIFLPCVSVHLGYSGAFEQFDDIMECVLDWF